MVRVSSRSAKALGARGRELRELMPPTMGGWLVEALGGSNRKPLGSAPLRVPTVTTTSAAPLACCGVRAVSVVGPCTATSVAAVPPIVTVAPAAKLVPVIVTVVPPSVVPAAGATALTVGDWGGGGGVGSLGLSP